METMTERVPDRARAVERPNRRVPTEALAGRFQSIGATPHPELWTGSGPILLLGAWCEPALAGLSGVTYAVLPNRWDDRALIGPAEEYCWGVFRCIAAGLTERLNELHGTAHPQSYWEFLLGPWLLDTIHIVYDRYLLASDARRLAPGAALTVPEDVVTPPATVGEGLDRMFSDSGNLVIFRSIFRALGLNVVARDSDAWGQKLRLTRPPVDPVREPLPTWRRCLRPVSSTIVRQWLSRRSGRRVLVSVAHFSLLDEVLIALRVPGFRVPPPGVRLPSTGFLPDLAGRIGLVQGIGRDEFENVLMDVLADWIPASFVERYREVAAASERAYGADEVPVVFTYHDEVLTEYVARVRSRGRLVALYQHGAGYGQYRTYPLERCHMAQGQRFLSWGFGGESVRPLPSPRLSRLRNSHRGGDRVVLVEAAWPKYLYRIHSKPIGHGREVQELLAGFVEALPRALRQQIVLKPDPAGLKRHQTVRHPVLDALLRHWPGGAVMAVDWMREARLAVITYPETAFVEALTMNVPTVGLWRSRLFEIRPEAAPYFAALVDAGVVFDDGDAAARHVARVYATADEWWQGAAVQRARQAFLAQFGLAARDWRRQWARHLREIAAAG